MELLESIHKELGIERRFFENRNLEIYEEAQASELVVAEIDFQGKTLCITQETDRAWKELASQAEKDGIVLQPFSGFRSYLYQKNLIVERLAEGRELAEILENVAIPGFSEHHTGRAIDITTPECEPLFESFETTRAFAWLSENANRFGFTMSFPKDNPQGYVYEPWHWCFNR